MALAGLKTMLAGAVRDRMAAAGVMLVAGILLLTAWVLTVAALVVYLSAALGPVAALLTVAAGLVVLLLLVVWITTFRNRRTAELRATTRALWAATAVNAASAVLRGEPHGADKGAETGSGGHRSALLIAGGVALMLLALLVPWMRDKGTDGWGPDGSGPDDSGPGRDGAT